MEKTFKDALKETINKDDVRRLIDQTRTTRLEIEAVITTYHAEIGEKLKTLPAELRREAADEMRAFLALGERVAALTSG